MFTGIVEELGEIRAVEWRRGDAARLTVGGSVVTADVGHGDSIAVNGVCLTVVTHGPGEFSADVMKETLDRSALGGLTVGSPVNLERAVTMATRLGGHLVQGHVDGIGAVVARNPAEHWDVVDVSVPAPLLRYIVEKGSITVDGVSLTVTRVGDTSFSVSLIPTTMALTTLGLRRPGDVVNLEVDVLAKYVERLLSAPARSSDGAA
jgi:riboflavin synthase